MKHLLFMVLLQLINFSCYCQYEGFYPPGTKWYHDPLGFRPLQLSSAAGFAYGSAVIVSSLLLSKDKKLMRKYLFQESGFSLGYKPPYSLVLQNNTGLIYQVRKQMALGLEWNLLHFKSTEDNTWNFGARPFARWYLAIDKRKRFFFEYGAGVSYSLNKFPSSGTGWGADTSRTGTQFNFTTKYGIGTEIFLDKSVVLQIGVRHFHLSNGNIKGVMRNPSHDSNGLFLGLLYSLDNIQAKKER